MASTFTGLKLQGAIGKFGNVELTDVAAFVELPDGKVLSSTETGELLLWDGGLIKVGVKYESSVDGLSLKVRLERVLHML